MQPGCTAASSPAEHPGYAGVERDQLLLMLLEERDRLLSIPPDEGIRPLQTRQLVSDAAAQLIRLRALGLELLQLVLELAHGPALATEGPEERQALLHVPGVLQAGRLHGLRMGPGEHFMPR